MNTSATTVFFAMNIEERIKAREVEARKHVEMVFYLVRKGRTNEAEHYVAMLADIAYLDGRIDGSERAWRVMKGEL